MRQRHRSINFHRYISIVGSSRSAGLPHSRTARHKSGPDYCP
jgi:hypothetical protein